MPRDTASGHRMERRFKLVRGATITMGRKTQASIGGPPVTSLRQAHLAPGRRLPLVVAPGDGDLDLILAGVDKPQKALTCDTLLPGLKNATWWRIALSRTRSCIVVTNPSPVRT